MINNIKQILKRNNCTIEEAVFYGLILPTALILFSGFICWLCK